ncbi:hypothetical protein TRP8649_04109 [Pelagimonas phthalicica]|uniref:Uncharacterized protein n=1 Tax=Pelagimonas phthalicica TaxID=1037362 RepID=A0A238JH27_9RHOB|nr:hypothetical protein CLV87_3853 [Pelagimonas phthalicica]SMX29969.1 hypothetical protein TRP8649_04109 [Pelagimonas phthalicica]
MTLKHNQPTPTKPRLPLPGPRAPQAFRYKDWASL